MAEGEYPPFYDLVDWNIVYAFRVDEYYSLMDEYLTMLKQYGKIIFMVREYAHITGKPHVHGFFIFNDVKKTKRTFDRKKDSIRRIPGYEAGMTAFGKLETKKQWYNYQEYYCKSSDSDTLPEVVINELYTEDNIRDLHRAYWSRHRRDIRRPSDSKVRTARAEAKTWFKQLLEYCTSNGITGSSNGWEIYVKVAHYYSLHCKSEPMEFQLVNYSRSIQRQLLYEQAQSTGDDTVYFRYLEERAKRSIGATWVTPVV